MPNTPPTAQGQLADFALHTLGWKAFQDLCAQICAESLGHTVSIYREAQDGGQDAVFLMLGSQPGREATVQCKFSSKSEKRLTLSDIAEEFATVESLVRGGRAYAYYFITSMGVDAPIAAQIRDRLTEIGVREPHVLGREWITTEIKASPRLRALVPRVYGLGDLSSILDHRSVAQTRRLLGHLAPSLKVYVPTTAHRTGVRVLAEHKLVLLLGAPATGKSMLAAILATMAIDSEGLDCLKCEGPLELKSHWNPYERKRLFWVDDAFGPNQLREDYVDAWIEFMPKIKAAMEDGNHFILTSRTHIWNEAAYKLGTRNHPLLESKAGVVNVGSLAPEERQQILYNHVKSGKQSRIWKQSVKPHLHALADERNLLPEIARRLGDPMYTTGIRSMPNDLVKFVRSPDEFLRKTFLELTAPQQAAMTLVFLARSKLPVRRITGDDAKLVADKYGTSVAAIAQSMEQLDGSYLIKRDDSGQLCWSFFHPTFADAICSILSFRPDLVDLYLVGAKIETLLSEAICENVAPVKDAIVIPTGSLEMLVARLLEIPNERELNERLFQFLNRRATDEVVRRLIALDPDVVAREGSPHSWLDIVRFAEVRFRAKVCSLGLLDEVVRQATCDALIDAATYHLDVSFLSNDEMLALFKPRELIQLTFRLVGMLHDVIPSKVANLASDADADADIDDQFSKVDEFVREMQHVAEDSLVTNLLEGLENSITEAKTVVKARKSDEDSEDNFFANLPSGEAAHEAKARSIFSDVDS